MELPKYRFHVQLLYGWKEYFHLFFSNELCKRAAIENFNNLCEIEVYDFEKSYDCTDIALQTFSWSSDCNRLVGFSVSVCCLPH